MSLDPRAKIAVALSKGTFPDRSMFGDHVPSSLQKIIVKCLSVDPSERFQSALSVANALAKVDQCLDWRPIEDSDKIIWEKNEEGTIKRFVINPDQSTLFTSTASGGTPRRKVGLCKDRMSKAEVRRVLKEN